MSAQTAITQTISNANPKIPWMYFLESQQNTALCFHFMPEASFYKLTVRFTTVLHAAWKKSVMTETADTLLFVRGRYTARPTDIQHIRHHYCLQ